MKCPRCGEPEHPDQCTIPAQAGATLGNGAFAALVGEAESRSCLTDAELERMLIDAATEGDYITFPTVPEKVFGIDAMAALKRVRDHYEENW